LGILFVTLYGKLPLAWYSGQILAQAIVTLIGFLFLYSNFRKNESNTTPVTRDYGKVFNFCWPLSIANILLWAQTESFRFILEKNATLEFLGNLSVGISLSISMASVIESLLHQIYLPTYYREITQSSKELREKAWSRMIATLTPVIFSATIFIILFSPFIMRLLVDAKYTQFYLFLAFGMIIQLFRMLSNLLSFAGQAEMQNRPLMYSYGVGALITLAGTLYFTNSQYDLFYVIPAVLMVSAATSFLILFFISKKILSIHFEAVPIVKMLLMTLPFLLSLLLNNYHTSTLASFVILGVFGLYFLLIQFVFYKKVFKPHGI
jgi:O-antigen/teichoic acid export membrane protein